MFPPFAASVWCKVTRGDAAYARPAFSVSSALAEPDGKWTLDVERSRATHVALVFGIIEWPGAVHGRAVVPDHEIIRAPFMAVDELILSRVLSQVAQQQAALRNENIDDVGGMRAKIQRPSSGPRNRAHDGMNGALELLFLFLRKGKSQEIAGIDDGVKGAQPFERLLGRGVERVISRACVGKFGVGAH